MTSSATRGTPSPALPVEPDQRLDALTNRLERVCALSGTPRREPLRGRAARGNRGCQSGGKYKGRAPTARRQAGEARRLRGEGVPSTEIARRLGIGRASVYRILAGRGAA